jgi:hypothetical protein
VRSCLGTGRRHNVTRIATERHDVDLDASMTAGDLLSWLGPHGPAAIAATSVFGSFMFVEQIVSDEAKAALARQLKSFDVHSAVILPAGAIEIFHRVFGDSHFSIRCIWRSICFSALGTGILMAAYVASGSHNLSVGTTLGLWALYLALTLLPDYLNLYKTRIALRILESYRITSAVVFLLLIVADFAVGYGTFSLVWPLMWLPIAPLEIVGAAFRFSYEEFDRIVSFQIPLSVFFYAGMLPSAWLWIYAVSVLVTRIALRAEPLVRALQWILKIDAMPIRCIATVAAALTFLVVEVGALASKMFW